MVEERVSILAVLNDQITRPLGLIGRGFSSLVTRVRSFNAGISPLTRTVTSLTTSFLSLQGALRTIELAEEGIRSETRLLSALNQRRTVLQQILGVTTRIQETSIFGGDDLKDAATTLRNSGVAVENLERTLQATVNTATALGISVQEVATSVGLFESGSAGTLGRRVGQLRELQAEGRLAAEGIQTLQDLFQDNAADLANTSFGRGQQLLNELGDVGETIGRELIDVRNAILEGLLPVFQRIAEFISSPQFRVIRDSFAQLAPEITTVVVTAGTLLASFITLGAAVTFLGPLISAVVSFGGILLSVGTNVGLVVAAFAALREISEAIFGAGGPFDDLADFFGELTQGISEFASELVAAFQMVAEGSLSVTDLFDLISTRFRQFASQVNIRVVIPLRVAFNIIRGLASATFDLVGATAAQVFLGAADIAQDAFLSVLRFVSRQIDNLNGVIADSLSIVSDRAADAIRSNLEGAIPRDFLNLGPQLAALNEQVDDAVSRLRGSFDDGFDQFVNLTETAEASIDQLDEDFNNRVAQRRVEREREEIASNQRAIDRGQARNAVLLSQVDTLNDRISQLTNFDPNALIGASADQLNALLDNLTSSQARRIQDIFLTEINQQLSNQINQVGEDRISAEDFLALRRRITVGLLEQELNQQRNIVAQRQMALVTAEAELRVIQVSTTNEERKTEAIQNVLAAQNELTAAKEREAEAAIAVAGANQEQANVTSDLAEQTNAFAQFGNAAENAAAQVATSFGEGIISTFVEGTQTFDEFLQGFIRGIAIIIARLLVMTAIATALSFIPGFSAVAAAVGPVIGAAAAAGGAVSLLPRRNITKALGSAIQYFAGGGPAGFVPGPRVSRDIVPAVLMPGEFVQRRAAVDYYGTGIMDALNRLLIPRSLFDGFGSSGNSRITRSFQGGGEAVAAATAALGSTVTPPIAVMTNNEAEADRLYAGNPDSLFRFVKRNRGPLQNLLRDKER